MPKTGFQNPLVKKKVCSAIRKCFAKVELYSAQNMGYEKGKGQ
jgi:hypothetical protein